MDNFSLSICQGKYTYIYEGGRQRALRYDQPWPSMDEALTGNKFVYSLAVELDEALKELAHKQYLIDNLMLEYCTGEMTPEQLEEWAKHQQASKE